MAEHDHWQDRSEAGGSIERLETALARIAMAAGRRQDALRVAELTARAAQHEADQLAEQEQIRRDDALQSVSEQLAADAAARDASHRALLHETAERLDALILRLRTELEETPAGD